MKHLILIALAVISATSAAHTSQAEQMRALFGPVYNLKCGLPPLPPLGCEVGECMCDQSGNNCRWTFRCR